MKHHSSLPLSHRRPAFVLSRRASALLPICAPLRLTRRSTGLCLALILLAAALPARAETAASTRSAAASEAAGIKVTAKAPPVGAVAEGASLVLRLGKAGQQAVAAGATFTVEGDGVISAEIKDGFLWMTPQKLGTARLTITVPNGALQTYQVRVVKPSAPLPAITLPQNDAVPANLAPQNVATADVAAEKVEPKNATPVKNNVKLTNAKTTVAKTDAVKANGVKAPVAKTNVVKTQIAKAVATPRRLARATQKNLVAVARRAHLPNVVSLSETASPLVTLPQIAPRLASAPLPSLSRNGLSHNAFAQSAALPIAAENLTVTTRESAQISPSLPPPTRDSGAVRYSVNRGQTAASTRGVRPSNAVPVTRGLARFFRFDANILSVYYSDLAVMDARAVNARTVAITGLAPGVSTLAVFTEQFPGDAIGKVHIYQINVRPSADNATTVPVSSTSELESAIRAAIDDPRVSINVLQLPNGTMAAKLSGVVRDGVEAEAAKSAAALFVPSVISGIYTDKTAPTTDSYMNASMPPEQQMQDQLRQLMDNKTISVMPFNKGLAVKAEVNSREEADQLLSALSGFGRPIQPFIVIRGAAQDSQPQYYDRPVLTGEDDAITRRLQTVTGVRTVYAVKVTSDASKPDNYGIAIYGTVRNRREYDTVRRYAPLLTVASGVSGGAQSGNIEPSLRSNLITTGKREAIGIKMFVRILNGDDAVVRKVTVETNIVEINRTSLKNLGIELGSVALLSQNVTAGTGPTITQGPFGPTVTPGVAPVITRTFDPKFLPGQLSAGNGIVGGEGFKILDPLRVRLGALYQNGNARILSSPNITALEGADAQLIIGGTRPIPFTNTTGGGAGSVQTSIIFRPYGILISMRPTLTDDDTIILQIRAEVTGLDSTTQINLGGTLIPGETTRGINTTLTVREGDTLVMGGIMTNERSQRTSRIPVLSDLPIIGSLFRSKRFENNQTELAIFMTPHITRQPASPNTVTDIERVPALPVLPSSTGDAVQFSTTNATGP